MKTLVTQPMYDWDGRKYIEFKSEGLGILRVKVPWRYGRVMCRVEGLKTVQELAKGDEVDITYKVTNWDGLEYLVLESIRTE
jgi:hypothetical protein